MIKKILLHTWCRRAGRRPYWLADPQRSASPPPDPADPQTRQSSRIASQSQPPGTETPKNVEILFCCDFTLLFAALRSRNDLISAPALLFFLISDSQQLRPFIATIINFIIN